MHYHCEIIAPPRPGHSEVFIKGRPDVEMEMLIEKSMDNLNRLVQTSRLLHPDPDEAEWDYWTIGGCDFEKKKPALVCRLKDCIDIQVSRLMVVNPDGSILFSICEPPQGCIPPKDWDGTIRHALGIYENQSGVKLYSKVPVVTVRYHI